MSGAEKESVLLPGSYDPVTLGHLDLIRRAAAEYREVYAVVFVNPDKKCRFSLDERMRMLALATEEFDNVLISESDGLVIDYMRDHDIGQIMKGYRNEADLAWEKKQAAWNSAHGGYPTRLVPCSPEFAAVSSTEARRRLDAGEDLRGVLPEAVIAYLRGRGGENGDK